jgi:hypothetical protein
VLEGGLTGVLVLYGAPVAEAAAGVLIYHAIAFWIPSVGGLLGYRRLRRHLPTNLAGAADLAARPAATEAIPSPARTTVPVLTATATARCS